MGSNKEITGLPGGAFIVNYYDGEDEDAGWEAAGWEAAEITGARPKQLFSQDRHRPDMCTSGSWSAASPEWNFAIYEGHPAHGLLCAIRMAVALGGEIDELVARAKELCDKELRNEVI